VTAVRARVPESDLGASGDAGAQTDAGARPRHGELPRARRTLDALADVGLAELLTHEAFAHVEGDSVEAAVEEFVRFIDEVVAPTDRAGDQIGCNVDPDTASVTTAPGSIEAYRQYVDAGWGAVPFELEHGGGGFPKVVGVALQEIFASANLGLSLCPALTQSAIELLSQWGSADQQARYLSHLLTGEWNGTMQITEPDAGSDVGAIRSTATPLDDGRYALSGTKIFISWGEHDLTENIVHLVLARTPGSAPGTKGLSLFVVPKFHVLPDGSLGERNPVWCRSIEHKMGLHSSPTCVMELDGAIGELVGELHGGMRAMFSMMNPARLAIGLQGLSVGETAYDEARAYAAERRQGTAPGSPRGTADTIDAHPDVRRMLSTMRSTLDAMRLVVYETAIRSDLAATHPDAEVRAHSQDLVELFTPIAKAWVTDLGVELASTGIQVFGGIGYSEEGRAPQRLRDARIAPIYEGTNGIQAIDLVSRKLTRHEGALMASLLDEMDTTASELRVAGGRSASLAAELSEAVLSTRAACSWLLEHLRTEPDAVMAGATTFLEVFGDLVGGWLLARRVLRRTGESAEQALDVAVYYSSERLVTVSGRLRTVVAGADRLFV
jgi:alkylation response protein AidB-like acyl-CoA dehydrogenase